MGCGCEKKEKEETVYVKLLKKSLRHKMILLKTAVQQVVSSQLMIY